MYRENSYFTYFQGIEISADLRQRDVYDFLADVVIRSGANIIVRPLDLSSSIIENYPDAPIFKAKPFPHPYTGPARDINNRTNS